MLPCVSVIILNWNGKAFLGECLDGLRKQVYDRFVTVVVDNGSLDDSVDFVLREYPEVRVLTISENIGFPRGNNRALKDLETQYVALLNNDAVPHPLWLRNLVDALDHFPAAGFAASKMLLQDPPTIIDRAGDSYTTAGTGLLRGRGASAQSYENPEWVFGACAGAAIYRTEMLRQVGLFDEDYFLLYEDVDLSFRAQLKGYKCRYVPAAIVYHKASGSIGHDSASSVYYSHRNLEWVYIQNMPGRLILRTLVSHILYDVGAFFFFATRGRMNDFVKAKWDALKGINTALKKRKSIQGSKKVNDAYIWSLFDKETSLARLRRRRRS